MTDYSKLSDQEINMAVATIAHPGSTVIESKSRPPAACVTGNFPNSWADYCNKPSDAWPIIVEHGIGIIPYKKGPAESWCVATGLINGTVKDTNPLRAAMIVFLKMNEK